MYTRACPRMYSYKEKAKLLVAAAALLLLLLLLLREGKSNARSAVHEITRENGNRETQRGGKKTRNRTKIVQKEKQRVLGAGQGDEKNREDPEQGKMRTGLQHVTIHVTATIYGAGAPVSSMFTNCRIGSRVLLPDILGLHQFQSDACQTVAGLVAPEMIKRASSWSGHRPFTR